MAKDPQTYFICGAPRSGTTVLLDFLTVTRETGWIPEKLSLEPEKLSHASKVRRQHWPLLGDFWLERRFAWKRVTSPAEDLGFWNHVLPGFEPDLTQPVNPDDLELSEEQLENARKALRSVCRRQGVTKFVGHYTGFPRVALLRKLFPDAKFIQMLRDPRSVAYHLVRRVEGGNHEKWNNRAAWKALMPENLQQRLESLEDTPLNFSGVLVRWYHELYSQAFAELPKEDWMEVAYADLLAFPEKTLKRVYKFADLKYTSRFAYYLKYHQIHQSNTRTSRNLDEVESEQLKQAVSSLD
jgi:hypothetical protein